MCITLMIVGCGTSNDSKTNGLSKISMKKWKYNSENDVYYQVGIKYCSNPADTKYETLGVFVPGKYMTGTKNSDGTYTCKVNKGAKVGNYTAENAPMVLPVNTPGYSSMAAPTDYFSETATYTKEGMIYIYAGCRGRDEGAPLGVTDLKAAIRYVRYTSDSLPGNSEDIFTFGHSGGGAQSALLGTTGDSKLYDKYLNKIGAVSSESDAVKGSMCWCPITNLDTANEAYEWNMGSTRSNLSDDMKALSNGLATEYAKYINKLGLKDSNGETLTLEKSDSGIYQKGSYYDYIKSEIETSLNNFLEDTKFPYTANSNNQMEGQGGPPSGEMPSGMKGEKPSDMNGEKPSGEMSNGNSKDNSNSNDNNKPSDNSANDNVKRTNSSSGIALSGTYKTAKAYIKALNKAGTWVKYDSKTNKATITSISKFAKAMKNASKDVGAFDDLNKSQAENTLFGYGDGKGAHFDLTMAKLLKNNKTYGSSYSKDLKKKDSLGNTVDVRLNMYNPMYYLCDYYDGYKTSNIAKYFRIRTGINQGDTAVNTEMNLALALKNYGSNVDFATVWGQGHTEAERNGNSSDNFIKWINECMK